MTRYRFFDRYTQRDHRMTYDILATHGLQHVHDYYNPVVYYVDRHPHLGINRIYGDGFLHERTP